MGGGSEMATTRKAPRKSSRRTSKANAKAVIDGHAEVSAELHPNGANPAEAHPGGEINGTSATNGSHPEHAPEHLITANNGAGLHQTAVEPTFEQIQLRAYHLFLARGCAHGGDISDWLTAERELRRAGDNT
jgi:phosphodiesterase/alkaline phosphatase D-like protein